LKDPFTKGEGIAMERKKRSGGLDLDGTSRGGVVGQRPRGGKKKRSCQSRSSHNELVESLQRLILVKERKISLESQESIQKAEKGWPHAAKKGHISLYPRKDSYNTNGGEREEQALG